VAQIAEPQTIGWYVGAAGSLVITMSPVVNITGWAIDWNLRAYHGASTALATKTTGAGTITLTTPASGIFTVALITGDTSALTEGLYSWDSRRTDSGAQDVLAYGTFHLRVPKAA
jgi:hypothetical protein